MTRVTLRSMLAASLAEYLGGAGPGVAAAIADGDRIVATGHAGFRDLAARRPVDAGTLFEIGSIGKSFAAVILLQLADEGRLRLDDPVVRHLPWFRVPRTGDRITIHHLLTHTAGITGGMEGTPEVVAQVWRLRSLQPGSSPGRHFHYSNVGYKTLGLVIERIEGRPYHEVLRRRLLGPLGMTASEPAITSAIRSRLAVGHATARDDAPFTPGAPLAPATWLETASADGSIAATIDDLASWMRWLMAGDHGFADRMLHVTAAPDSDGYGYALRSGVIDGRAWRGHGGGMVGYFAGMQWDVEAGLGAVVLQNGPGADPDELARLLVRRARALRERRDPAAELPELGPWDRPDRDEPPGGRPAVPARTPPTPDQAPVVGRYRSHDPWTPTFRIDSRDGGLWLSFAATPDGSADVEPLVPLAGGWFRLGAARHGPERIRFDLVVEGVARRAWLSGWPWYRVDEVD